MERVITMEENWKNPDSWNHKINTQIAPLQRLAQAVDLAKELGLENKPRILSLLRAWKADLDDTELERLFYELIKPYRFKHAITPNPFKIPPPDVMKGNLYLGKAQDGNPVYIDADDMVKGMFVSGMVGTGKSTFLQSISVQLIELRKTVWIFDTLKKDNIYLSQLFPNDVLYFDVSNFRFNPFAPTAGRTDKKKL